MLKNNKIFFCKKCVISNKKVLPSTTIEDVPNHSNRQNMEFNDEICSACEQVNKKYNDDINWKEREKDLLNLLKKYRSTDGSYDCIVPGSGGKDSVFQSYILKEKYKMNPLTVTFSPRVYTDIGMKNFHNWPLKAGVSNFLFTPNGTIHSKLTKLAFKNLLHPFQPFIMGQRHFASHMAKLFNINLIFMGETQSEYGGQKDELGKSEMLKRYWTKKKNQEVKISGLTFDELKKYEISKEDLAFYLPLNIEEVEKLDIQILYLGHYEKFRPQENYYLASRICDFQPNDMRTEQTFSKYKSLDDKIDSFHYYTAYVKFGLGRCSEEASKEVRDGYITRQEAVALVHKYDHEFPKRYFSDFLNYIKMKEDEFYDTLDKFRDENMWENIGGDRKYCQNWKLKYIVTDN